jgi:RNA polymerase sigma factor (TIGR02999 family)
MTSLGDFDVTDSCQKEISQLLRAWSQGDEAALESLTPLVYEELHRLAKYYMARERPGHILQTTALVNEAYLRLLKWEEVTWQNRAHFFGVSAHLMRRILVDFARKRIQVEGENKVPVLTLDEALEVSEEPGTDLVAMDDALEALAELDPRKGEIVELRFFGGLTVNEVAEVMNLSPVTVAREWSKAKAWLLRELEPGGEA